MVVEISNRVEPTYHIPDTFIYLLCFFSKFIREQKQQKQQKQQKHCGYKL